MRVTDDNDRYVAGRGRHESGWQCLVCARPARQTERLEDGVDLDDLLFDGMPRTRNDGSIRVYFAAHGKNATCADVHDLADKVLGRLGLPRT